MFEDDPQYGSGKTTVTFLNKEDDAVYIEAFSCQGFRLGNGFRVIGPTAFFPKSVLHWNVCTLPDLPTLMYYFSIFNFLQIKYFI